MPRGGRASRSRPEDVPVRDDHAEIGVEPAHAGEEDVTRGPLRLQHRESGLLGHALDGGGHKGGPGAAVRAGRAG